MVGSTQGTLGKQPIKSGHRQLYYYGFLLQEGYRYARKPPIISGHRQLYYYGFLLQEGNWYARIPEFYSEVLLD